MNDSLVIEAERDGFHLVWIVDGDTGASVGDDASLCAAPEPADRDEWEMWVAAKIAKESGARRDGCLGFMWDSCHEAAAVLRQIKGGVEASRTPAAGVGEVGAGGRVEGAERVEAVRLRRLIKDWATAIVLSFLMLTAMAMVMIGCWYIVVDTGRAILHP